MRRHKRFHLFHEGSFIGPFVYGYDSKPNLKTFRWEYTPNPDKVYPLRFFCRGDRYKFWNLWYSDFPPGVSGRRRHRSFFWVRTSSATTCSAGLYTARAFSLTVGLIGITISFFFGITLGGLAGYYGGWVDSSIQRVIEILRSIPELPLWLALSAALPVTWSPIVIYLGITVILGLLDWPGLARAVRSKLLALREEDYATAAVLMGAKPRRVYRAPSTSQLHEPSHRQCNAVDPCHDPGGNIPVVPGTGFASADHKLGCTPESGPEPGVDRVLPVDLVANDSGHSRDPGVQFPR